MDNGNLLRKYVTRPEGEGDVLDFDAEDLGVFSFLRGIRDRCPMLELRRRDGDVLAVGYGFIDRMLFRPSKGIELTAGRTRILIEGRNLNVEVRPHVRLFETLTRHRVAWIREVTQAECMEAKEGACVIEAIRWDGPGAAS
jgi:hypothetical protein